MRFILERGYFVIPHSPETALLVAYTVRKAQSPLVEALDSLRKQFHSDRNQSALKEQSILNMSNRIRM
jgi:hypothetical protein